MTTATPTPVFVQEYAVWNDHAFEVFTSLEEARAFANTIPTEIGNEAGIYEVELGESAHKYDSKWGEWDINTDVLTCIETIYESEYTKEQERIYNSPEAIAVRKAHAATALYRKKARLRARPVIPGMPKWQERYDQQDDGSFRLKPQFR